MCGFGEKLIGSGFIALNDVENVHSILINGGLVHLTDLQSAKHLVGIIAVAVFMRSYRRRLGLAQRNIFLRSVRESEGDISLGLIHIVSAKSKLALNGNDVVNIHRTVYAEHIPTLHKQPDKIFTCRDILAALYAHIVVEDIEPLQHRVGVNVNILVLVIKLSYAFGAVRLPFIVYTVIIHALHNGKNDLYAAVKNFFLNLKFHDLSSPLFFLFRLGQCADICHEKSHHCYFLHAQAST